MLRRLNRKSRVSSSEASVYGPEPKYAVQSTDEEKRRVTSSSSSSQQEARTRTHQPSGGGGGGGVSVSDDVVFPADVDDATMTLEAIKLKRKVSVSQSGKVHRKSSRNSVVDIFGDNNQVQHLDDADASRQPRNTSDLKQ